MPLQTVTEALRHILREIETFPSELVPLDDCLGLTLAEDVISEIDSPPFDKALMDGYAVRSSDLVSGTAELRLAEEVMAGQVPTRPVEPGTATRIMTGAPIPEGADAVVRVEDSQWNAVTQSVRLTARVGPGHNILRRATSVARGQRVIPAGRTLRAQELGALAELGRSQVRVRRRPTVAVLATGDELVPVDSVPGPGQIRNSNETMLTAQITQAGGIAVPLGISRDRRDELGQAIRNGLKHDLFLLTGGVSAGKLDLAPSELAAAGVREVFHKVDIKPGKPIWFGTFARAERNETDSAPPAVSRTCGVFGLPGNPVSSLCCFELFVRTAMRRLMGVDPAEPIPRKARLAQPHIARGDRPTYHPARLAETGNGPVVQTVAWHGSSDLCGTLEANAMALFPAGDAVYEENALVDVFPW